MGMDLIPVRPSKDAPRYPKNFFYKPYRGQPTPARYDWGGWSLITGLLVKWGVKLEGFSGMNDGEIIKAAKCREVADAIEKHLDDPDVAEHKEWLKEDIILWRTCGGYRQY